jgi:malate permease and related proteins
MIDSAYFLILAMLALGYGVQRAGVVPASAVQVLNRVVLYVCLPAAVLRYVPQLKWQVELLGLIALPWLLLLVALLAVWLLGRVIAMSDAVRAVLLLSVALGNTSFLGYPIVRVLIGEHALPYAVVYDQFGAFLMLSTFGLWVLARYGGDARPGVGAMLRRIALFPPLWALLIGVSVMPAAPPAWIATALRWASDALLPLAMLTVGLALRFTLPREMRVPLAAGLALKLALLPALAWLLVPWLGLRGVIAQVAVLESAMPAMISAAALAIAQGLAPRLAAALVGYGVLLSMLTLPLWAQVQW